MMSSIDDVVQEKRDRSDKPGQNIHISFDAVGSENVGFRLVSFRNGGRREPGFNGLYVFTHVFR